jgi:predicted secreted protein
LRMGLLLGLTLFTLLASSIWAQPEEVWNGTFGGPGHEVGGPISATGDGGYVLTGMTESYGAGNGDLWLLKVDRDGRKVWDQAFGGGGVDVGESVMETEDGGIVVAGYTTSFGAGGKDAWLLKADADGNEEWDENLGGPDDDAAWSVVETEDGGIVLLGYTDSYGIGKFDVWLLKTDADGVEVWNRTFGGPGDDEGMAVGVARDGGLIIAGRTDSYGVGGRDAWLIKADAEGNEIWERTFGGAGEDCLCSVQEIDDGYAAAGFTSSFGSGKSEVWLLRTDSEGTEIWNRTFGISAGDFGSSVVPADDGGLIVTGWTSRDGSRTSPDDALLIKTDSEGGAEWTALLGGDGTQSGVSVLEAEDGGIIVSGFSNRGGAGGFDLWMTKLRDG